MGELAQTVERPLRMREVPGSITGFSNIFPLFWICNYFKAVPTTQKRSFQNPSILSYSY